MRLALFETNTESDVWLQGHSFYVPHNSVGDIMVNINAFYFSSQAYTHWQQRKIKAQHYSFLAEKKNRLPMGGVPTKRPAMQNVFQCYNNIMEK